MKTDLDRLKVLYQGYAASRRPVDRRKCPSPRVLARSFEPSLSGRRQRAIADHISECPACREEFTLFLGKKRAETASPENDGPDVVGREGRTPRRSVYRFRPAWQGASVLIGIGLAVVATFVIIQKRELSDVVRASGSKLVLRLPKAGQALSRPLVFRWAVHPDVEYYVLELFDDQMLPIWTSEAIRASRLALPHEVASSLQPGTYYWMVTGFTAESQRMESGLSRFTLRH